MCPHTALEVFGGKQGSRQVRDKQSVRLVHAAELNAGHVLWMARVERVLNKKQPCDGLPTIICRCSWCRTSARSQAPQGPQKCIQDFVFR